MRTTKRQLRKVIRERCRRSREMHVLRLYVGQTIRPGNFLFTEGALIHEGLTPELKGPLRDIVKVAVGAGAVVITGGMGGDTVTDAIFAIDSAETVMSGIKDAISGAGELGDIINAAMAINIRNGPDAVYNSVLGVTQKLAAGGAEASIDKVKAEVDALIEGIANAVGEWIAVALPDDAGLGGIAMREVIESAIASQAEDMYGQITEGFNRLPILAQDFIKDPAEMAAFFNGVADDVIAALEGEGEGEVEGEGEEQPPQAAGATEEVGAPAEEEEGLFTKVAGKAGEALKPAAEIAGEVIASTPLAEPIIDYLDGDFREMIAVASPIPNTLVTVLFGAVAFLQIVIRGEYKTESESEGEGEGEGETGTEGEGAIAAALAGKSESVTIHRLRQVIRESIKEKQRLDEANIIKGFLDNISKVSKTLDDIIQAPVRAANAAIDKAVGPHMEKLRQWMEDNAESIPGMATREEWKEVQDQAAEMMKKAEEAREQWKEEHPGEDPPWEKTFLGIQATDWLAGTPLAGHFPDYIDPGHKAVYGERKNMKITKKQLQKLIHEVIKLDIKKGDVILTGRFKNKRAVVREIGTDEYGHPTINGKSILRFKIEKKLPKEKWSKKSREKKKGKK